MWLSLGGLAVTLALNVLLVPHMGYMGCAWAALGCYGSMMLASWWAGKVHYPIGYDVPRLCLLLFGALVLWGAGMLVTIPGNALGKHDPAHPSAAAILLGCPEDRACEPAQHDAQEEMTGWYSFSS